MSVIFRDDGKTLREIDYIGTHPAGDSIGFNLKIREFSLIIKLTILYWINSEVHFYGDIK